VVLDVRTVLPAQDAQLASLMQALCVDQDPER